MWTIAYAMAATGGCVISKFTMTRVPSILCSVMPRDSMITITIVIITA